MNVEEILRQLDMAVIDNRGDEAEEILMGGVAQAMEEGDNGSLLQLLNELLGFYRETGRVEESYKIGNTILSLLEQMGLEGSIPYATSLLNIANAYRAGGRLGDSLSLYNAVEQIYKETLPENSMLMASFYNNKSLLCQEMGSLEGAIECLYKALPIVEKAGAVYEAAVTHANLANSYTGLGDFERAFKEAVISIEIFESIDAIDSHYAAALYALGICLEKQGKISEAKIELTRSMMLMEETLGKTEFYYRIKDELERCADTFISGMELARCYYEDCLKPQLEWRLPNHIDKIAVGLTGRGSDCYGYDDAASRDHDWGPGLCIFVSADTYAEIGEELENIYSSLPEEYKGCKRGPIVSGHKRRGVFIIEDFYKELLGKWPIEDDDYVVIQDYRLSEAVNGEIFTDPEGTVTQIRAKLGEGYPTELLYKKIAQAASLFSQKAQYNYPRMLQRGDNITAQIMKYEGIKEALKLVLLMEGKYMPHDKWLYRMATETPFGQAIKKYIDAESIEAIGQMLALKMYEAGFISDSDDYLDHHAEELMFKALYSSESIEELADKVTKLEFKAFDKVQNEGGRASCQDDYYTFEIMRKSQYLSWTKEMLIQYLYDFERSYKLGHNLITEKYGRMMESTAPEKYIGIKDNFPELSDEKKAIIEQIVALQVEWMEDFTNRFRKLGGRARSIHTNEDFVYNTSYETYLRGEISTYSDKMLELYGRYIVSYANSGKNVAEEIMKNCVRMYGYDSLEAAEEALSI